jgi:hypothetical protein
MSNKKKTAVDWLFEQLPSHLRLTRNGFEMFQQAKAMEKQQIIEAYKQGHEDGYNFDGSRYDYESHGLHNYLAEDYYKNTYDIHTEKTED